MSVTTSRVGVVCVLLGLLMIMLVSAGCPPQPAPTDLPPETNAPVAPTGEPIKIGGIFAITGVGSALGTPEADTAQMLQDKINAEGGINGRPLEIVIRDTKSDETEGLTVVKELIEKENVLALVGPSRSGTALGIIQAVEDAEVPMLACAASAKITDPVKKWVFVTPQNDHDAVARIYQYLNAQGITKIGILTASSGYGISGLEQLEKQASDAGLTVVAKEEFTDTDTDMNAQLTSIKGTDAEAIVCWGIGAAPSLIAKSVKQLGITIPLIMSHGVANRKFIEDAGDAANGVILPAGKLIVASQLPDTDPQKQILMDYADEYQAKFGKPADTFGGHAWDGIMLVVDALRAGAMDRAAIRDHIEGISGFTGIGGTFNFSPESHYGLSPDAFVMVQIENGDWKLISD